MGRRVKAASWWSRATDTQMRRMFIVLGGMLAIAIIITLIVCITTGDFTPFVGLLQATGMIAVIVAVVVVLILLLDWVIQG